MVEAIRVLISEDHEIFRKGLKNILEDEEDITICGEAADGEEAIALSQKLHPDIVLMDIGLPKCSGIAATAAIVSDNPHTKVIILSVYEDDESLLDAIRAGAQGYLTKSVSTSELVESIRNVFGGESVVSPMLAARLMAEFEHSEEKRTPSDGLQYSASLTKREMEVLQSLAGGKSNKEISDEFYISERTVKFHVSNILDKLHLENRTQAASFAHREGLINFEQSPPLNTVL